jgi:hypothetical protein
MTVRDKFINMLVNNGMFEEQAKEVMQLAEPKLTELADDYNIRFDSPAESYPNAVYNVLFISIKATALQWIDANKPQAWYRLMFE